MKALTKLSNTQKTLALFGILAMNISWMSAGVNSGDFASRNDITAACPTIDRLIQQATTTALGQTGSLTCRNIEITVGGKKREVSRTIYVNANRGKVCGANTPVGAECSEDGLKIEMWTELADESSACEDGECGIVTGDIISLEVPDSAKQSALAIARAASTQLMNQFEQGKADITRDAKDMLAAAERELKEEELERERDRLAANCEILHNTTLEAFEKGQKSGNFGDDALQGKERLECFQNRLAKLSGEEANDYFYNNVMPFLQDQLTSSKTEDQNMAQRFINSNINSRYFTSLGIDRGQEALAMAAIGGRTYQEISQFKKNMNPNDPSSQMQLQMFQQTINAKFGIYAQNGPAGDYMSQNANYWTGRLNEHLSGGPLRDTFDMSTYVYANNRIARVQPNTQLYTLDIFNDVQSTINATYDSTAPLANTNPRTSTGFTGQRVVHPPQFGQSVN